MTIRDHDLHAWVTAFHSRHRRWPTVRECARGLRTRQDVVRLLTHADRRLRIEVRYPNGDPTCRMELVQCRRESLPR